MLKETSIQRCLKFDKNWLYSLVFSISFFGFFFKCKQDIKMQIAVTTIDIFHNIVLFVKEMCVCGASPDGAQSNRPVGGDDRF